MNKQEGPPCPSANDPVKCRIRRDLLPPEREGFLTHSGFYGIIAERADDKNRRPGLITHDAPAERATCPRPWAVILSAYLAHSTIMTAPATSAMSRDQYTAVMSKNVAM